VAGIRQTKNRIAGLGVMKRKAQNEAGVVRLSARASALFDEVLSGWQLDAASREQLRLGCESLTRADEAGEIVSKEGQVFRDRWGQIRPHPAAILERDHRQAAARILHALGVSLEGN
jgi:hypothetical protein